MAPILQRVALDGEHWLESVASFGRWLHRAVGHAKRLKEAAARAGRRWLQGLGSGQAMFLQAALAAATDVLPAFLSHRSALGMRRRRLIGL